MKVARTSIGIALLLGICACNASSPGIAGQEQRQTTEKLSVKTLAGRTHTFRVEVARTAEQQSRGLMFRTSLAPDAGMIFPMNPPRYASFWMKNTVIPLDMIFIRADGSIAAIAAETVPYSLSPVGSGEPVAAVLEIAGGRAAALGIGENDVVKWRGLRN